MNKNRRAQKPKNPLAGSRMPKEMLTADLERRRSSAGSPQRAGTDYRRRPKHKNRGWE